MDLEIRFRWLVNAQVLLGIIAFCMAEKNPVALLIAGVLAAASLTLVEGPNGTPLPRFAINLVSVVAVGWLLFELFIQRGEVIVAMGHFCMALQVVLLYAKKSNRDYGQLLALSLLLMVGASLISTNFVFGIMLAAYFILALFTILMLQLKSASDEVMTANQAAAPPRVRVARPTPVSCRGAQIQFRTLAVTIGLLSAILGIFVYVIVPREANVNQFAQLPLGRNTAGFSTEVDVTTSPGGPGSREAALIATVYRDGENISSPDQPYYLRGIALDRYDSYSHTWSRSYSVNEHTYQLDPETGTDLAELPPDTPIYEAHITARGNKEQILFTLDPVSHVQSSSLDEVRFSPRDRRLAGGDTSLGVLSYRIRAPVDRPGDMLTRYRQRAGTTRPMPTWRETDVDASETVDQLERQDPRRYARSWTANREDIQQTALEVILAANLQRDPEQISTPQDQAVAQALADWLRDNFDYALTNREPQIGEDPIWSFMKPGGHRSGHCEIFAAAHAALCRSVGIPARLANGYYASEYNRFGNYYVVRPKNAHSWTEVLIPNHGWVPFDATPPEEVAAEHAPTGGVLGFAQQLYEYLEFFWLSRFIAYNMHTRAKVVGNLQSEISETVSAQQKWLDDLIEWIRTLPQRWQIDGLTITLAVIILTFIFVGIISLVRRSAARRRRLIALQLNRLPRRERLRLAKHLGFYLAMLEMLEEHGHIRPSWQSPFGFAQELTREDPDRYAPVLALTEHFYEIRFGRRELDDARRRVIRANLNTLQENLMMRPKNKSRTGVTPSTANAPPGAT